jgi:hypothetical protein
MYVSCHTSREVAQELTALSAARRYARADLLMRLHQCRRYRCRPGLVHARPSNNTAVAWSLLKLAD